MLPSVNTLPNERRGYVDGPVGQVHYREQGEGPVIMLIHQAPWSSIQYRRAMPLLAARGFRVIAPDMPGHGMSSPPAGAPSIELYADAVAAVTEALAPGPVAAVGHHGGSLVAAHLAAAHPDKLSAIVTDNMPYYDAQQRAERMAFLSDVQEIKPDGSHFSDRWSVVRKIADPSWTDETIHVGIVTYFANGPYKEQGHVAAPQYDLESNIDAIRCPVLVIAGRTDRLYPMGRKLIGRRPDWSYAELPGGPGMIFERTGEWIVPIVDFINKYGLSI